MANIVSQVYNERLVYCNLAHSLSYYMLIRVKISLSSDEDLQDDNENTHTGSM
jgi:hypothetical protein